VCEKERRKTDEALATVKAFSFKSVIQMLYKND